MTAEVSRRNLFRAAGAISATAALPKTSLALQPAPRQSEAEAKQNRAAAAEHPSEHPVYLFFNEAEARFIEAATSRLIPKDEHWPGADEVGVPVYIDRQLAGAYGAGSHMYLGGPWQQGTPAQGYQLPYTPAQLYRVAIGELHKHLTGGKGGRKPFHQMSEKQQDQILKQLETGKISLPNVPSDVFFETLLANTIEGFFADPAYGGNRNAVGWRMVGFPGAYASYVELVDKYGVPLVRPPLGIAARGRGETG